MSKRIGTSLYPFLQLLSSPKVKTFLILKTINKHDMKEDDAVNVGMQLDED